MINLCVLSLGKAPMLAQKLGISLEKRRKRLFGRSWCGFPMLSQACFHFVAGYVGLASRMGSFD
jgi:hypothetical protein